MVGRRKVRTQVREQEKSKRNSHLSWMRALDSGARTNAVRVGGPTSAICHRALAVWMNRAGSGLWADFNDLRLAA